MSDPFGLTLTAISASTKALYSSIQNRALYTAGGEYIGYSTIGHDGDLCNAIAHIDPKFYSLSPSQWYIRDFWFWTLIPVSKYCMDKKIRPKWSVVDAGTGKVTIESPTPGAPAMVYAPKATGGYVDNSPKPEAPAGSGLPVTTTVSLVAGAAALIAVAVMVSR